MLIREVRLDNCELVLITPGTHILTVAEAGFAMLVLYAGHCCGWSIEDIGRFADRVNEANEAGS